MVEFLVFIIMLYVFCVVFISFYFYYFRVGVMSLADVADENIFRFRLRFKTGNKRTTLRKPSRLPKREIHKSALVVTGTSATLQGWSGSINCEAWNDLTGDEWGNICHEGQSQCRCSIKISQFLEFRHIPLHRGVLHFSFFLRLETISFYSSGRT